MSAVHIRCSGENSGRTQISMYISRSLFQKLGPWRRKTHKNTRNQIKTNKIHPKSPSHKQPTTSVSHQRRWITYVVSNLISIEPTISFSEVLSLQINLYMRLLTKASIALTPAVTNISLALSHLSFFNNNLRVSL